MTLSPQDLSPGEYSIPWRHSSMSMEKSAHCIHERWAMYVCTDESSIHLMSDKSRRVEPTESGDEMVRKVPSFRLLLLTPSPHLPLSFYPEIAGRGIIMINLSDHPIVLTHQFFFFFIFITHLTTTVSKKLRLVMGQKEK